MLIGLGASACVKESRIPTITVYTCAARDAQLGTVLKAEQPLLPTIVRLPSGERVYVEDNGLVYHYDGPVCQE